MFYDYEKKCDGQQSHRYQQNEKLPLTLNNLAVIQTLLWQCWFNPILVYQYQYNVLSKNLLSL